MKKIVSILVSLIILATMAVSASALDATPDIAANPAKSADAGGYVFYTVEGMEHITVTSSNCPLMTSKTGSAVLFDHNKDTGYTFTFKEGEEKTVTVYAASRECLILDRLATIAGAPGTTFNVTVYGTDDASLKDWTLLGNTPVGIDDDGFAVRDIPGIDKGYAFYRIDFTLKEGNEITVSEIALMTSHIGPAAKPESEKKDSAALLERDPRRIVRNILRNRHKAAAVKGPLV